MTDSRIRGSAPPPPSFRGPLSTNTSNNITYKILLLVIINWLLESYRLTVTFPDIQMIFSSMFPTRNHRDFTASRHKHITSLNVLNVIDIYKKI